MFTTADPLLQVAAWAKAQLAIADVASMAQRAGCVRSLLSTRWQQRFGLSPGLAPIQQAEVRDERILAPAASAVIAQLRHSQ